jgi:hypothetical protein
VPAAPPACLIQEGGASSEDEEWCKPPARRHRSRLSPPFVTAQVRVTGGLQQLLPSFLPSLLFRAPEALERLAWDDERNVIYTLGANSSIQVGCDACDMCVTPAYRCDVMGVSQQRPGAT